MNKKVTALFGEVLAPDNFEELISMINENIIGTSFDVSFWRGQANINWPIDSGAVRRLQNKKTSRVYPLKESSIVSYEKNLLNKAKKNLFNIDENNRTLSDLELLAKLQHHGAATRLVDFSKNVLVALFFCVDSEQYINEYGLLLGVHTHIVGGHEDDFNFNEDYETFASELSDDCLHTIAPPVVTNRISAQHAVLLCSKFVTEKYGSLYLGEKDKFYKFIAISPNLKKQCKNILINSFDITRTTMFPDLSGFCEVNSSRWEIGVDNRW